MLALILIATALLAILAILVTRCGHRHLTRAFTINERTYVVCLGCGREFPYSLVTMSIIRGAGLEAQAPGKAVRPAVGGGVG